MSDIPSELVERVRNAMSSTGQGFVYFESDARAALNTALKDPAFIAYVTDNHTDAVLARLKERGVLKKVTMPGPQEGRLWLEAEPAQSDGVG